MWRDGRRYVDRLQQHETISARWQTEGAAVMARKPMTLEELRARRPFVDRSKVAATTEDDIRRHKIEDGEDPDAPVPPFQAVPNARDPNSAIDDAGNVRQHD
jgi:hypothetical protein